MTVRTTAGSSLQVSAATPATFDAAGYAALTYTNVGEITDFGDFGRKYNVVKHNPVDTRATQKLKGSFDSGTMSLKLGLDPADAGQDLMRAALNSDTPMSALITTADGTKYYFQGLVTSFVTSLGNVDQVTAASCDLEVTATKTGVDFVVVDAT